MNKLTLRKSAIAGFSTMALSMLAFSAQALPMVTNGSFEKTKSPTGSSFEIPSAPKGATDVLPGWTAFHPAFTNGTGFLDCVVFPGTATTSICGGTHKLHLTSDPGLSPDKGNYIAFDGDSTIAFTLLQTITGLVVGQSYNVSFYQAAAQLSDATGDTTERWDVSLGAQHLLSPLMENDSKSFVRWSDLITLPFTVTGEGTEKSGEKVSRVLSFFAVGTPKALPPFVLLDGVSITAVPEPETLALMGIGLVGILLARRQPKKSVFSLSTLIPSRTE